MQLCYIIPQVSDDNCKFDLVCLLEDYENIHIILTDALMEVGTVAVDSILSKVNVHSICIQYMYTVYKANVVDLNLDGLLSICGCFRSLQTMQNITLKNLRPESQLVWGIYWASF